MNVGIVAQRDNPRAAALASEIRTHLDDEGVPTVVDETTAAHLGPDAEGVSVDAMAGRDLVVSIGGDGTFLFAARGAGTTPIMGVNLGEVGFLNAVSPDVAVETVDEVVREIREDGGADTRSMHRLQARGDGWTIPPAINEVAVLGSQRGHGQGVDLDVTVDGATYTEGHADGVLIATPTGSTAYNLSEDGPLVHPDVSGLIVTEMAGESEMPPLVVDIDSEIEVTVENSERAVVVGDGRTSEAVTPPATVTLERAEKPVRVAGPPLDFFAGLGKLD
ncbi:NAD(+)/NADH kinase [Halorientalis regularis]|jgi:NAD+ kinase|uniref:NAD kinase n=1 Tax=Halorientalis regularis TaxID=660518 RepID=A0A1G7HUT7_9EURY|nr:NAD(+)/NADH kinase [Halorientalis regularis]SDF04103.1 NAD+ kinase [Halorientalis regularis]